MLQEVKYGALTRESNRQLSRAEIAFFETQGAVGGTLTTGGRPGWFEKAYGWFAAGTTFRARK